MLDSDNDEERDLPEEEQRLVRRTKVRNSVRPLTDSGQTPGGDRGDKRGYIRMAGCACGCSEGYMRQGRARTRWLQERWL